MLVVASAAWRQEKAITFVGKVIDIALQSDSFCVEKWPCFFLLVPLVGDERRAFNI